MTNFFVSYNKADEAWAVWIAWQLESAGYSTIVQAWDFRAGSNFVLNMQAATSEAERTIAVLSPDYLTSSFTPSEWAAAFGRDPTGKKATLVPVRIRECNPEGLLPQIIYVDLLGLDERSAKDHLLNKIKKGPRPSGGAGPIVKPPFPGAGAPEAPTFPGGARDYSRLNYKQSMAGTGDELFCVAFSRDGRWMAAGSNEKVLLWNRDEPDHSRSLAEHGSYVYSVAFSHDSRFLVSGGEDGAVRLFDVESGEIAWKGEVHKEAVYSVAFSPDGKSVVSGGYDKVVHLWDAEIGELRRGPDLALNGIGRVTSVAFSPDGATVAFGSLDDMVRLWDLNKGIVSTLRGHASSVEAVAFSPDGSLLASCGLDKTVRVWDVTKAEEKWCRKEHEYLVRSVAFSPDGETLASAGWDKAIKLWDARTGVIRKTLPIDLKKPWHTDWIWSVAFSPEGTLLASSGSDSQIFLWRVPEPGILSPSRASPVEGASEASDRTS